MTIRATIIFLFLFVTASLGFAFDLEGVELVLGEAVILNGEPVETSPVSLLVSPVLGASVPMRFTDMLYFEPGLRVYGFDQSVIYILDTDGKPVPAARETRNRIEVINFEIRPEIGAIFDLSEKISLGITVAPEITFRLPFAAYDDALGSDQPDTVLNYFLSDGRFFGAYAGGFFSWNFGEGNTFRLKAGTNLPVYHIWDGNDAGFHDQMVLEPEIGFIFLF